MKPYSTLNKAIFVAFILFCFFIKVMESKDFSHSKEHQIDKIFKDYSKGISPGCAIVVVNKGKIVFLKTYGYSNIEHKIPVTAETMFNLASNSKQFTAYYISKLIKQNKISLNDNIVNYLPKLSGLFKERITIKNLIHHSSGIRGMFGTMLLTGWKWNDSLSNMDYMTLLLKQRDLNFKPGDELEYNNSNYLLLAEIIESISGNKFKYIMENEVFKPLGMKSTVVAQNSNAIIKNCAQPYRTIKDGLYEKNEMPVEITGSTSVYTNIKELGLWLQQYSSKSEIVNRMFSPETLNSGKVNNYCFGINANFSKGEERTYTHLGSLGGYNSYTLILPDRGFGVGVLGNDSSLRAYDKGYKVTQILYPDIFGPLEKKSLNKLKDKNRKVYNVDKSFYKLYIGKYCFNDFKTYLIKKEQGKLFMEYVGGTPKMLIPIRKHVFLVGKGNNLIEFNLDKKIKSNFFTYTWYGQKRVVNRIKKKTREQIVEICGKYYSPEIDINIKLSYNGDHFLAEHFRWGVIKLYPSINDTLVGYKSYFKKLSFYRDKKGISKGFKLYGHTIRNLKFKKAK